MLTAIICTYNRARYVGKLLESIAANDLAKTEYELLLVDNNCTDNTREVCEAFAAAHPDVIFRYTTESEQGLSAAKNRGIKEAKGDIIVYIDDDALVDPWYLRTYAEWFATHPETMACGGPIEPLYETSEPDWMTPYTKALLTAWMNYGEKVREYPRGRYPGGGNAAYRKEVFEQVGGFNTALGRKGGNLMGSEEKDIFDKMHTLNMQILYLPEPVLHHCIPQAKLEKPYFDRLTLQMGISERQRTLAISKFKYIKRLFSEAVKWGGTIVLLCLYTISFHPVKGWKLVAFRKNVTKGLLGLTSAV
ncbi:MAG: glycosyltransferase family 2 protein [Paludibacteraceae bacterium]|nr:glycosyltransferase family 2 protein [Paludibacteraceae bacterium]